MILVKRARSVKKQMKLGQILRPLIYNKKSVYTQKQKTDIENNEGRSKSFGDKAFQFI